MKDGKRGGEGNLGIKDSLLGVGQAEELSLRQARARSRARGAPVSSSIVAITGTMGSCLEASRIITTASCLWLTLAARESHTGEKREETGTTTKLGNVQAIAGTVQDIGDATFGANRGHLDGDACEFHPPKIPPSAPYSTHPPTIPGGGTHGKCSEPWDPGVGGRLLTWVGHGIILRRRHDSAVLPLPVLTPSLSRRGSAFLVWAAGDCEVTPNDHARYGIICVSRAMTVLHCDARVCLTCADRPS